MLRRSVLLVILALFAIIAPRIGSAQQKPNLVGNYLGSLGPLHLKLHLKANADGTLQGAMDSPDQGAVGLACADFHYNGKSLSFTVPIVHGTWSGTVSSDGKLLSGTWNQGSPMPLNFARDTFVPATKPTPVDGIWLGTLSAGKHSLRAQLTIKSDQASHEYCTFDSLDQGAMGLECAKVVLYGNDFSFDVPVVHGHWSGKLAPDDKSLTGIWSQGTPMPLNFQRQSTALAAKPIPPPTFDPAMPPVPVAELQSVLDRDLASALKNGALAPGTQAGVAIGVAQHGVTRVFTYGTAQTNSIFEIGSITKTFTGLVLAQMVAQKKVKLDEPVRWLLPAGTVAKPEGPEITLLDLVTQHSGLPRMPDNFHPADKNNPYADYRAADLYAFLAKHGVAKPADPPFLYSNLGFGLLGQALADRAKTTYPKLLQEEATSPLGMKDTVVSLSPGQQRRFIQGHDAEHHPVHAWDLDAMAGAGAIRSTASDMLIYLDANLHPEKFSSSAASATPAARTLSTALTQSHELRADVAPGMRIAFAWLYNTTTGNYWHNGGTGGYTSYAFFNPKSDDAAVVLSNTSSRFADLLGEHIGERLSGKPAISLSN